MWKSLFSNHRPGAHEYGLAAVAIVVGSAAFAGLIIIAGAIQLRSW